MKAQGTQLYLSATDLTNHLACHHLTTQALAVQRNKLKPIYYADHTLEMLRERGYAHEAAYLAHLEASGLQVCRLPDEKDWPKAHENTRRAMARGEDVIAQAGLYAPPWCGYADVLMRVAEPSTLGSWSYEVHDTKLSKTTKVGAVLQLCLYTQVVGDLQGLAPEWMAVVPPGVDFVTTRLRALDYLAYFRFMQRRLLQAVQHPEQTYPEPVAHCAICNWYVRCDKRWRDDDHLSLVANLSRAQRQTLAEQGIHTLADFAALPLPLPFKPARGSVQALEGAREQARLQLASRGKKSPLYELILPLEVLRGLSRLPAPHPADMFFDFEGDPFVEGGGLEYLWGWGEHAGGRFEYQCLWALTREEERRAFDAFMTHVQARWEANRGMHIYHYAPYEPAALKRLANRFDAHIPFLDNMLRKGLFVDLYGVVRQGLRAGVESYSIKKLEPLFAYVREVALPDVGPAKAALERALELTSPNQPPDIHPEWAQVVEVYNKDDCAAAQAMRDWLEKVRREALAQGHDIPRPPLSEDAPEPEDRTQEREETKQRRARLLEHVPEDPATAKPADQARKLLADMLEFHRREERTSYWEYFRLADLNALQLVDERKGLGGLLFEKRRLPEGRSKLPIDRYMFPPQECDVGPNDAMDTSGGTEGVQKFGTVVDIDTLAGWVDIRKRKGTQELHPPSVFTHEIIKNDNAPPALANLADWIIGHGLETPGAHQAQRDLLCAAPPRLRPDSGGLVAKKDEGSVAQACRLALTLEGGVLAIQGPPGAGKTYTGARMVVALLKAGHKVGITAVSHKVIHGLIIEVVRAAQQAGLTFSVGRKADLATSTDLVWGITVYGNAAEAAQALAEGKVQLLGGTAWQWCRGDMADSVHTLVLDEAGQLSLANALAVAQASTNLILLGDPAQLEQPQKAAHPPGADISALQHIQGPHATMSPNQGLFLASTRRQHPKLCQLTSELFYENRLQAAPGCELQCLHTPVVEGAGFWLHAMEHTGNDSSAPEEAEFIAELVERLLQPGATWTDAQGTSHPLQAADILVLAPYNAQVSCLRNHLPEDVPAGTVDIFQGREAPLVILSMTSSSTDLAPRGMDFLLDANRLNVATSRARAACILVASSSLFEAQCRTPEQMKLVNALCRIQELALPLRY